MSAKALAAKLDRAAGRMQPALRILGQIRAHIDRGSPSDSCWFANLGALVDELESELYSVEAAVGVITQPSLFEPFTPERAELVTTVQAELDGADDLLEPAMETFAVDCDNVGCGKENMITAPIGHTPPWVNCQHCGRKFEITG